MNLNKRGVYFKRLDELRFFAFFLVFWQHAFNKSLIVFLKTSPYAIIAEKLQAIGAVGVHIFFVISGFLITYLMVEEEKIMGNVNLSFFYIRRTLRIWPLYFVVMLSGIFMMPFLFNTVPFEGSILKNLFFLNNFDIASASSIVAIAWSVAIEEQFYLVWPLLFIFFRNKGVLMVVSALLFIVSTAFILQNPILGRYHTLGNINYLMAGCLGGILYGFYGLRLSSSILSNNKVFWATSCFVTIMIVLSRFFDSIYLISLVFLPVAFLYVVVYLVEERNLGNPSYISRLGKYTYGMYLFHPTILLLVKIGFDVAGWDYITSWMINLCVASTTLILTVTISVFSYKHFETPILKLKSRFSSVRTRV